MPVAAVESVTQIQARDRAQRDADRARMHVQQVGNDLGVLGVRQRRADDARRAVVQRVIALNRCVKPAAPRSSAATPSS